MKILKRMTRVIFPFFLFHVYENTISKKKWMLQSFNCATESCYKNISKIRNATFICQNLKKMFEIVKKN